MVRTDGGSDFNKSGPVQMNYKAAIMLHINRIANITALPPSQFANQANLAYTLISSVRFLEAMLHPYLDEEYRQATKDMKVAGITPAEQIKVTTEKADAIMDLLNRNGMLLELEVSEGVDYGVPEIN